MEAFQERGRGEHLYLLNNVLGPFQVLSFFFFFFRISLFYLFLAVLGLRCCPGTFSSCGEWGLLFVVVHGLLIGVASLVAEHRL